MPRTAFSSNDTLNGPKYFSVNGGVPTVGSGLMKSVLASRATVNTPGFKKRKTINYRGSADLPFNPFSFYREVVLGGNGDMVEHSLSNPNLNIRESGYLSTSFGNTTGGDILGPTSAELDRLRSQVNAKLLEKLKNQKVNLAQVYAERKMTADLIGDTAIRIASSFSSLKKGDFRGAARSLGVSASRRKTTAFNRGYGRDRQKAISNGWLELQYGWRPLLQDIYGSAEFLANKQCREVRAVVSSKQTRKYEETTKKPETPNYWLVYVDKKSSFDYKGTIRFSTTGAELATVKEAGLTNPAALAWELTPYSFVVDWFIPIGDYLNSLDADLGLNFNSGCYTTFWRGYSSTVLMADNYRGANRFYSDSVFNGRVSSSRTLISNQRVTFSSFPSSEPPTFKNPFSFEHAANAIALLFQTFKR